MPIKIFKSETLSGIQEQYIEWEKKAILEKMDEAERVAIQAKMRGMEPPPIGLSITNMQLIESMAEATRVASDSGQGMQSEVVEDITYILIFLHN